MFRTTDDYTLRSLSDRAMPFAIATILSVAILGGMVLMMG